MPQIIAALTPCPYAGPRVATRHERLLAQMAGAAPLLRKAPALATEPSPAPGRGPETAAAAARARHANLLAQLNRARGRVDRLTARLALVAAALGADVDRRRKLPAALTL